MKVLKYPYMSYVFSLYSICACLYTDMSTFVSAITLTGCIWNSRDMGCIFAQSYACAIVLTPSRALCGGSAKCPVVHIHLSSSVLVWGRGKSVSLSKAE